MAGQGTRFAALSGKIPKPFFLVDQEALFLKALLSWEPFLKKSLVTFIIQNSAQELLNQWLRLISTRIDRFQVIGLDFYTQGPLETAMSATQSLPDDQSVIFQDCDCYVLNPKMRTFLSSGSARDCFAAVSTFESQESRYSYVRTDSQGLVQEAAEKRVISNQAIGGAYYFPRIKNMKSYDYKVSGPFSGREPVISEIMNQASHDGEKVLAFPCQQFFSLGTSEEFQQAQKLGLLRQIPQFEASKASKA